MADGPGVAFRGSFCALLTVLLPDVDVVVVQRIGEVPARATGFSREDFAGFEQDDVLAAVYELIGGGYTADASADDTRWWSVLSPGY